MLGPFSRHRSAWVGTFLFLSLFSFHISHAETSDDFRLGPGLEEPAPEELPSDDVDKFHYNPRDWNEMRRDVEEGREPGESRTPAVVTSSVTVEAPKPPPGKIQVDLPYE